MIRASHFFATGKMKHHDEKIIRRDDREGLRSMQLAAHGSFCRETQRRSLKSKALLSFVQSNKERGLL